MKKGKAPAKPKMKKGKKRNLRKGVYGKTEAERRAILDDLGFLLGDY